VSEAHSKSPGAAQTVLGFDYGTRRIGIAVGQRLTGSASGVAVVSNHGNHPDWPTIERTIRDWAPDLLVVGLPLDLEGGEQPMSAAARGFARALSKRFDLQVLLHDERLTSIEAGHRFAAARRGGQRRARDAARLDAVAAEILIESWFETTTKPMEHTDGPA
jgi:putative Holliday junction resolvase